MTQTVATPDGAILHLLDDGEVLMLARGMDPMDASRISRAAREASSLNMARKYTRAARCLASAHRLAGTWLDGYNNEEA